ncbi:alpha-amylase [Salinicoccus hispanicus]|uniref:Alpha-amylase n=1 Tax=Salinicoccus hispanicus TaxID=157225 RepID=A0A6N8U1J5_9STAP|nr:alpha-amylase [Salinicoccus hispanicus]MXQ51950.1 alpha-amylase [Salinicoccus hispanicus]
MSRKGIWILLVLMLVAVLLLLLPLADRTSRSERVIVDHTLKEIFHPGCFDQAETTNYLDEVSFSRATETLGYQIEDGCSKERLETGKESVISKIFNE